MVANFPVACSVCGCTIRLRYQVSEIRCPIKFLCPDCKTEISGYMQTVWHYGREQIEKLPWHYDFKLKNATEIDETTCKYVLELSPDLSTNKIMLDTNDIDQYVLTPFMRQVTNPDINMNLNNRFYKFVECWENEWDNLKVKIDLCYNEKYDVLLPILSRNYNDFPDDINCIISVHHELILFCNKILPKNILKEYTKLAKKINKLTITQPDVFADFTKLFDFEYSKQLERKALQLIKVFLDMYPKFLPVFTTLKITEYKDLGISTMSFEDVKSFYQDAYELILYNLPRIVALNNINCRKDINNFVNLTQDFEEKINSYKSKVNIYRELISEHDDFSWLINNAIENHIRNSIGHFNYEENLEKQTIIFIDDHMGKQKTNTKTLMEIARDCVYMFYSLVNLLELNYNILKTQIIIKD